MARRLSLRYMQKLFQRKGMYGSVDTRLADKKVVVNYRNVVFGELHIKLDVGRRLDLLPR